MTDAQKLFGRVFFELLARSRRIRTYLAQIGPGDSKEFEQLSRTITSALDQFESTAAIAVAESRIGAIDAADEGALLDALAVFSQAFSTIHIYLTYFPPLPIRPETVYTLKSAFGAEFAHHQPSLLLTNAFNAFEFDFLQQLHSSLERLQPLESSGERNIVLQLPKVDLASALAWPLLAHEMGHAIDFDRGISAGIAERLAPGTDQRLRLLITDICEELTADLVAARVLGPSAVCALLSFIYCVLPQEPIEWDPTPRLQGKSQRVYPASRWRARIAYDYLATKTGELTLLRREVEDFEKAWRFRAGVLLGEDQAATVAATEQSVFSGLISTLAEDIVREVDALPIVDFSLGHADLSRHAKRLERGLPVSAQGESRTRLLAAIRRFKQKSARSRRDFHSLVARFEEKPTTISAILLSGCVQRDQLISTASAAIGEKSLASAIRVSDQMERMDLLLRTSIDASAVDDRLIRRRKANEAVIKANGISSDSSVTEAAQPRRRLDEKEKSLLGDIQILSRLVARNDVQLLFVSPLVSPLTQLGPSSLDVRLGTDVYVTATSTLSHLDLEVDRAVLERQKRQYFRRQRVGPDGEFFLHPGEFVLATTLEYFRFPRDIAGRLEGRSSLGRLGLQVHATAGFVDPGFEGNLTFELINSGNLPIRIAPGFRLGQLCFFPVSGVQVAYGDKPNAKYSGSISAEPSRIETDPEILLPGAEQYLETI